MYHLNRRVTYSEISADKQVNIAQIVNYMQDCSTFESISVGETLEHQKEQGYAWLLAAWQIEVERYPEMGEEITIGSWHCGKKGILAYRNFDICDSTGNRIVSAHSIWFYFDLDKHVPKRILDEYVDMYGHFDKLPMEEKPRKITLPQVEPVAMEHFPVRKSDLDTNGHVNNAKYIEMALEHVDDSKMIIAMRADYRKSALYGDIMCPFIYEDEGKVYVEFKDVQGDTFVILEFKID